MGRKILRRAKEDLKRKIKNAKRIIFFLDYDGTLTPIRKRFPLAKISKEAKAVLRRLAGKKGIRVFIVSGRILRDVKKLIGVRSLYYIGNHGIELVGPGIKYVNLQARALRPVIQKAYRALKKKLKIKGVILENKIYTLSVHYRLVRAGRVVALKRIFNETVRDLRKNKIVKITEGKKVLEVRPDIEWNKGTIVKKVLKRFKSKNTLAICIGDDKTDEDAFRALGKRGISILVSRKRRKTFAQYRLKSPKEVIKLLKLL